MVKKVRQVAFHRNGISGFGFHAVLFDHANDDDGSDELMVGVVFDEPHACAVLRVADLSTEVGVRFGDNSWRGDRFEEELREAIRTHESDGSFRLGPFGLPTDMKKAFKSKL